jgi:mono/diheme cytochrome c family protein
MKSYILSIIKIISLSLILMLISFGLIIYAYFDQNKHISVEPQFYCGVDNIPYLPIIDTPQQQKGQVLFMDNCASCHTATNEVLVGPGLKGVTQRKTIDWIVKWVHNSQKMIANGTKYDVDLFNTFNRAEMPAFPNIKEDEIKAILAYIDSRTDVITTSQKL